MGQFILDNLWLVWLVLIWTIPWKAIALWKSARANQLGWFIALLLINTLAVLEILYIYIFCPKPKK